MISDVFSRPPGTQRVHRRGLVEVEPRAGFAAVFAALSQSISPQKAAGTTYSELEVPWHASVAIWHLMALDLAVLPKYAAATPERKARR